MEDWESVKARLEKEGAGNQTIAADIRAALERAEELEREKAELLPGVDAPHRRIKGLERERDEWRDTARSEMAGRAAAEAAIASLEDNADVWEQRALKAEAEFASLLRTYNAAAQAWGRDEAALTAERARLTALLDVSERKLGEWRDRGAALREWREAESSPDCVACCTLDAALAPAQPEEESQDSPDFRPKELDEFAARGFERINRRAPEVKP